MLFLHIFLPKLFGQLPKAYCPHAMADHKSAKPYNNGEYMKRRTAHRLRQQPTGRFGRPAASQQHNSETRETGYCDFHHVGL
jgi:hypothetical protein